MSQEHTQPGGPWMPAPPPIRADPPKPVRGPVLGWIALGLGVLAVILAVLDVFRIPWVGTVALCAGVAGIILAIVALALRSRPKSLGVLGLIASAAACVTVVVAGIIALALVLTNVVGGIAITSIAPAPSGDVVFSATGTATTADVTYGGGTSVSYRSRLQEAKGVRLPFQNETTMTLTGNDSVALTVTGKGHLHCSITINGVQVIQNDGDDIVVCIAGVRS